MAIHPQILLMLIGGGRHIEDLREIINDYGLRRLTGLKNMPSTSTLGDWIRRQGNSDGLDCIKEVIYELNRIYLKSTFQDELTLWSDPTIIGTEKDSANMTYSKHKYLTKIVGFYSINYAQVINKRTIWCQSYV